MKRWLYETGKSVATKVGVVKPPKESKFFEKGQLTPKEFVLAGDQLVKSCPTWCWRPAAKGYVNKQFPKLKQFLYTKVPCRQRIKDVSIGQGKELELEDGWFLITTDDNNNNSQQQQTNGQKQEKEVGKDFLSSDESDQEEEEEEVKEDEEEVKQDEEEVKQEEEEVKEDEIAQVKEGKEEIVEQQEEVKEEDIQQQEEVKEEFTFEQEEEKEEVIVQQKQTKESQEEEEKEEVYQQQKQMKQQNTQNQKPKQRNYDLTITYDVYYFTPRMWLVGYQEDGTLLTEVQTLQTYFNLLQDEMFDDIMGDYQNKTVTLDPHPCLGTKQISIHPCKHASAMKHLIDMFLENGGQLKVHQAMFVFLKFISSVVPTIEYDFTVNMSFA